MRSGVAEALQFTAKHQAGQVVGTQAGTIHAVLLYGDTHTPTQTVSAFAETRKTNL